MALTSILRKSASSLRPLAGRLFRGQRVYSTSIFNAFNNHSNFHCRPLLLPSVSSFRDFSSSKRPSSDESLIRVIDSEIKCASETDDHDRVSFTFSSPGSLSLFFLRFIFQLSLQLSLRNKAVILQLVREGIALFASLIIHEERKSDSKREGA